MAEYSENDTSELAARARGLNQPILNSPYAYSQVRAYVKNHDLGLEVPYRFGRESRKYRPNFIVLTDDGHCPDDLLHLIVEFKGYRREDAKEKKATMDTY